MTERRTVNGVPLEPIHAWRVGSYLITTDSVASAETGLGYFTVARVEFLPDVSIKLTTIDMVLGLADAVTLARHDFEARKEGTWPSGA